MAIFDRARQDKLQQELATRPITSGHWLRHMGTIPRYGDIANRIIDASNRPRALVDEELVAAKIELLAALWLRNAAGVMKGRHPRIKWVNIEIVMARSDYSTDLLSKFLSTGEATGCAMNNLLIKYLTNEITGKLLSEVQTGDMDKTTI